MGTAGDDTTSRLRRKGRVSRAAAMLAGLWRREDGAAAIEFGLLGPLLFVALVTMVDVGLAVSERMAMDHIVRSGAQLAMADLGESNVRGTILLAAEAQQFPVCAVEPATDGSFCPRVEVRCFCPNGSSTPCSNPSSCPVTYQKVYNISATKVRESLLLPNMSFEATLRVQAR